MSGRSSGTLCLLALLLTLSPGLAFAQSSAEAPGQASAAARDAVADARALAERIDRVIDARLLGAGLKPAAPAANAEYFRRLTLDLNGRIPTLLDIRDFLDDDRPNKRALWVDRVLDNADASGAALYPRHFANVWRSLILNGNNANFQLQAVQPGFEEWLRERLQANTSYDKIVRELLTSQPFVQRTNASPAAFYIDNENKAENLAASSSRIFLGVKLECAQCHPHPFAKWTRNQFWEYAAFFGNFNPNPNGRQRPGPVLFPKSLQIQVPGTDKIVKAKFLDGKDPEWKSGQDPRTVLVDWMTAADNPWFARAAVDHVWSYFFGVSLLGPIIEPADDGVPTHPELLDLLAREFREHQYDLKFLVRAIANTRAYQRTSTGASADKDDLYLFARMPVRGLSPEQVFDSVAEATEYKDPGGQVAPQFAFNAPMTPRREFLAKFSSHDKRLETHTSILQALFMMNGKFLAERTRPDRNTSLATIANSRTTPLQRIETLYLMALSRLPRPEESQRLLRYLEDGGPTHNPAQALSDIYWVLLNSGEFALNH